MTYESTCPRCGNGPMNAKAVRFRAAILAELIGVPLRDETDIPVNLRRS